MSLLGVYSSDTSLRSPEESEQATGCLLLLPLGLAVFSFTAVFPEAGTAPSS